MKLLQAPNLKTIILTNAIYTAIHSYDEQAFIHMSVESEKNKTVLFRPVPSQGMVEQAKKHGGFRPQRGYPGNTLKPQTERWSRIA